MGRKKRATKRAILWTSNWARGASSASPCRSWWGRRPGSPRSSATSTSETPSSAGSQSHSQHLHMTGALSPAAAAMLAATSAGCHSGQGSTAPCCSPEQQNWKFHGTIKAIYSEQWFLKCCLSSRDHRDLSQRRYQLISFISQMLKHIKKF